MLPKISIIIPCYNMGEFVDEALKSVLSYPTQNEIEVIIVNDGSNDNNYTKKILDSYNYDNVFVIHQSNKGLGNARNTGIKLAKSPFLILLDSDNRIRHNYIKKGIEILSSEPNVGVVYGNNKQFGLSNKLVNVGDFDITKLLVRNYIDACVVLRKSAWLSINGYDEDMPLMGYEDWDLNLRLFFKGWEFKYFNEILFDYRLRHNSMLENSLKNVPLLISYIFSKPELKQARLLRNIVLDYQRTTEKLEILRNRKIVKFSLNFIERFGIIFNLFNKKG